MSYIFRSLSVGVLILLCSAASIIAADSPTYMSIEKYFDDLTINNKAISTVEGYTITREGLTIVLSSGTISFAEPWNDRTHIAYFTGVASLRYMPTTKVETDRLAQYNEGQKSFYNEFTDMVLFFNDSLYENIVKKFPPQKLTSTEKIKFPHKFKDLFSTYFEHREIIWSHSLLDARRNSSFHCMAYGERLKTVLYEFCPTEPEPISFYISKTTADNFEYNFVNLCPSINPAHNPEEELTVTHNTLDVKIDNGLKMAVTSQLRITVNSDEMKWASFNLYEDLTIESIKDEKGNSLEFFQPDESNKIWIHIGASKKGQNKTLTVKYGGKIIKRIYDYTIIETSIQWYPTYGYKQKSLFDITFAAPDNYKLISIGNKVSEEKKDGEIISRWTVEYPIRNASFNIGPFSTAVSDRKDVPPITLHYINSNNKKNVLTDIAQAYEFYTRLFGPLPLQSLNATEIPYTHGEAFPGMLHLSWLTFEDSDNSGAWQSFNAHETGHQWWGIGLDYKTYRDRWLSEGFTEYSSLMYLQMMLGDNKKFFDILKNTREKIINAKKQRKSDGVDLCPISLGHRVASTSLTREDYHTVIYEKGAWTLHMLRNILLNLNTMNEDAFKTIMKDFFTTYQGKSASIADFQKIVEKHVKQDVSWFFEQWVHGSDIPVYHFAFKTEKTPDDKFKVHVRVEQKEVPPDFKMSIPIKIVFENGSSARIRVFITGAKSEFDLPPLASAPKEIIFNDLESVLATVKIEDWE